MDAGYGYESERNENERDDSYASDGRVRGSKNNGTVREVTCESSK